MEFPFPSPEDGAICILPSFAATLGLDCSAEKIEKKQGNVICLTFSPAGFNEGENIWSCVLLDVGRVREADNRGLNFWLRSFLLQNFNDEDEDDEDEDTDGDDDGDGDDN